MYRNDSRLEKVENIEEYSDNLINDAFYEIQYMCETHFNALIDKNDMVVMDSSTDEKMSYHLIFNINFEHFNKLHLFVKTFLQMKIDEQNLIWNVINVQFVILEWLDAQNVVKMHFLTFYQIILI